MITDVCQRWRDRRAAYRPAGECIDARRYEVAPIADDRTARAFVEAHHYAASYPAARFRFGLFRGDELAGVAVFSHPCNNAVLACLPGDGLERTELGRFVLLDDVPANGESWMLARCFEQLAREGIVGVVSFSDPVPRTTADGRAVFLGHAGTIYQATNATYVGRARADMMRLLPDGSVLHRRALAKLRSRDRGWRYVADRIASAGAVPLLEREDAAAWADRWVPVVTRRLAHPGNHKYLFGLTKSAKRALPPGQPYPKLRLESLFAETPRAGGQRGKQANSSTTIGVV